jgi:uncharacterized membrane protein YeiH
MPIGSANLPVMSEAFLALDLIGVLANAILGGITAKRLRFDLIGFSVLAVATGLGGGIIRDVLLGKDTPVALTNPIYIPLAAVGALIAFVVPIRRVFQERLFPLIDALALGAWAYTGTHKGLDYNLDPVPAIVLGIVSATGGGMVRDLLSRKMPVIFGDNTLYATSALLTSVLVVIFYQVGDPAWGALIAMVAGSALTIVSAWRGWTLPTSISNPFRGRDFRRYIRIRHK